MKAQSRNRSVRAIFLMVLPVLLLVGCSDELVGPAPNVADQSLAPKVEGPELVSFKTGSTQSVDYLCDSNGTGQVDITVLRVPDGASYDMEDMGGDHNRKVTVMWNPPVAAAGIEHEVFIQAESRETGLVTIEEFGIEVVE